LRVQAAPKLRSAFLPPISGGRKRRLLTMIPEDQASVLGWVVDGDPFCLCLRSLSLRQNDLENAVLERGLDLVFVDVNADRNLSLEAVSATSSFGQAGFTKSVRRPASEVEAKPRKASSRRRFISRCKVRNGLDLSSRKNSGRESWLRVQGMRSRMFMAYSPKIFEWTHCARNPAATRVSGQDCRGLWAIWYCSAGSVEWPRSCAANSALPLATAPVFAVAIMVAT
jgi:hypothetical protein